jgi:hypothetical protein
MIGTAVGFALQEMMENTECFSLLPIVELCQIAVVQFLHSSTISLRFEKITSINVKGKGREMTI